MTNATWDVRKLRPDEWALLRDARLHALMESPDAFLSSHDREVRWREHEWRSTFAAANWLAVGARTLVGLLRSTRDPNRPWLSLVESTWVAPTHRNLGIFRALLRELVARESANGTLDLLLWVIEDNDDARQVYRRLGFEHTGERQRLPGAADRHEVRLRLGIADLSRGRVPGWVP